jgi:hypothetical protein
MRQLTHHYDVTSDDVSLLLFLSRSYLFFLSPHPHTHTFYPIYLKMLPERITDISKEQSNCQNPISRFRENRLEEQTD